MFDFPGLTYEGTMSADGNSMSGTMTYAKRSLPLALQRTKPEAEWAIPAAPAKIAPMAPDAKPDVEVATIKPHSAGKRANACFNARRDPAHQKPHARLHDELRV